MRCAEGIVNTFLATREPRDTAFLAQLRHTGFAAGEDFVAIRLVAYIPDQAIIRCVEYVMQCNRELDCAQIRREMSASRGHRFDDEFAQLFCQRQELPPIQFSQIGRVINLVEQWIFIHQLFCSLMLSLDDEPGELAEAFRPAIKAAQRVECVL